jgi:hypothetical protein
MPTQVVGEDARIGVVAARHRIADDERDAAPAVEILDRIGQRRRRRKTQHRAHQDNPTAHNDYLHCFFHHHRATPFLTPMSRDDDAAGCPAAAIPYTPPLTDPLVFPDEAAALQLL